MDPMLHPLTLEKVKLRYLLPLGIPPGEFIQSRMKDDPECPWKPTLWPKDSSFPPHAGRILESSLCLSTAHPTTYDWNQEKIPGISKRLGLLGLKKSNRWVITTGVDGHEELGISIGNSGLLSTKVGLAFIWLDITLSNQDAHVIFNVLQKMPTHFKGKKKGILTHQLNPHPDAYKDYPETHFSVVALLLELARNAGEWCGMDFGEEGEFHNISNRALAFGAISATDGWPTGSQEGQRSNLDEILRHSGFQLLPGASPTWSSRPSLSALDRHGFWGRSDTLLYIGTGNTPYIRENMLDLFFRLDEHFLSFILTQGALIMANQIEDDMKESAANRNLGSPFLSAFRNRFETAEWNFLQVQWNLDHALLHMDPTRFNVHDEYRHLLGVPGTLDRIQAQSELINAFLTRKFERSLQHFVFWGAVVGAITGLGGINVRHLTSEDDVGISTPFFYVLSVGCLGLLAILWLRSFMVRDPAGKRN